MCRISVGFSCFLLVKSERIWSPGDFGRISPQEWNSARRDLCIIWREDTRVTHNVRMRYFASKYFVSCWSVRREDGFNTRVPTGPVWIQIAPVDCSKHHLFVLVCLPSPALVYIRPTPAHLTHILHGRRIYLDCSLEGLMASKSTTICCSFAAEGMKARFLLGETQTWDSLTTTKCRLN